MGVLKNKVYAVADIAKAFIALFQNDADGITSLKLQKLLYYAQGFSFQRFGEPLFSEDIEAWEFGPAVNEIYAQYTRYGKSPIYTNEVPELDDRARRLILDVAREYGKYTTATLVDMTHKEGSPWAQCFREGQSHIVIPKDSIQQYFIEKEDRLPEFEISRYLQLENAIDLTEV